ncbi:hypothetical protein D020_3571A, partial [Vibrio parahaemolyticus SBR10290]|jgi:tetratricopeptide (TPR) repeat protein
MYD